MSAFTPEQWAAAGEVITRTIFEAHGLQVTDEIVREARDAAVHYATTGRHLTDAGQDER